MSPVPHAPVSWGELLDKIAILEIKVERLHVPEAVAHSRHELELLLGVFAGLVDQPVGLATLREALSMVNKQLWEIEDNIRAKEAAQSFDAAFIALARAVYQVNDERSRIKRAINELLGSEIVEEKQYVAYARGVD